MGLIKLALIGGAAYWAGKKVSEHHQNQGYGPSQDGPWGGCHRRGRRDHHQQQQQQQQFDHKDGQGMTRDMQSPVGVYHDRNTENAAPMYPGEYPFGHNQGYYGNDNYGYGYGHDYAQPPRKSQDMPRDSKTQNQNQNQNQSQIVRFDGVEREATPALPAYGAVGRPLSPQERMFPQQQQQQQQMNYGEAKRPYAVESPFWK